jgi:hypothetical protein
MISRTSLAYRVLRDMGKKIKTLIKKKGFRNNAGTV